MREDRSNHSLICTLKDGYIREFIIDLYDSPVLLIGDAPSPSHGRIPEISLYHLPQRHLPRLFDSSVSRWIMVYCVLSLPTRILDDGMKEGTDTSISNQMAIVSICFLGLSV